MSVQKDVIYRVYRFSNERAPYSLFIWDMIDFEGRNVLKNIATIFPDTAITQSAITARFEDSDELICEFETLSEIVNFPEELNIYRLELNMGPVTISIKNEDQFTLFFDDINILPTVIEFAKDQLDIFEIEKYLHCIDKPNVYHCFDYYGKFMELRNELGDLN